MSVTDYGLEMLLIYEDMEKLREQYDEEEFIDNVVVARKIERLLKASARYIRRARRIIRAYE